MARGAAATPEDRFERLVDEMVKHKDVTPPSGGAGFGRSALRCHNKIFAMLVRDQLVVKLPKARVDALIDAGDGVVFDANKGKPMKEWVGVVRQSDATWRALATEALDFARR